MNYWLAKTEPETYSYADLETLGRDKWNGVRNFRAIKHIKSMRPGCPSCLSARNTGS